MVERKGEKMKVLEIGPWVFYLSDRWEDIDPNRCGKWMYFFADKEYASNLCWEAVQNGVVAEAKHNNDSQGVCCFYLNSDDIEGHKRTIQFFLDNNLIRRTKTGKLYNISFKLDEQTEAGEYGESFHGQIKLDMFMDLSTGEWKI